MNLKNYIILAIFSFFINIISIFNAVIGLWSLIIIIFAVFIIKNRDDIKKPVKDKKVASMIQTFMLGVVIFISSVMGLIGILTLRYVVFNYLSSYQILLIILAVVGLIIYYFFVFRLLLESIRVIKNKGHQ